MKAIKFCLKLVLGLALLAALAAATLPLWLGPSARVAANVAVPRKVGTDFAIGSLRINPYAGTLELEDLRLGNPRGYSVRDAVRVGRLAVDVDPLSLNTDLVHVRHLSVKDVYVSVLAGGEHQVSNFTQLQYNLAGGKEEYEDEQCERLEEQAEAEAGDADGIEACRNVRVVIDRLELSGLTVQYEFLPIRLPVDVVLTDVGRKSGGVTLEELWTQIVDAAMKSAGAVGGRLKALGGLSEAAAKDAGKALGEAAEALNSSLGGSSEALGESLKSAGEKAKKTIESLKDLW